MTDLKLILEQINQTLSSLPDWNNLSDFVGEFHQIWLKLGNLVQQELVQSKIEEKEAEYESPRTKREKKYYTPLGEMVVKRRVYATADGLKQKVDEVLKFPEDKWLSTVLELACALGVSSEFPNSHQLFQKWTTIELTEKTLANQVEKTGNILQEQEFSRSKSGELKADIEPNNSATQPNFLYVGVDGVMTPLNQKQGYKEAKVGVIFWNKDYQKGHQKRRGRIRQREYVATLKSRHEFSKRVFKLYNEVGKNQKTKTIVIGDGAHWIWEMAQEQFPGAIEILDFYHLSEYLWKVAKAALPCQEEKQEEWTKKQQKLLKKSQGQRVLKNCYQFKRKKKDLSQAITDLERYLNNNKNRIDYQSYSRCKLSVDERGGSSSRITYANSQPLRLILGTESFRINQTNSALESPGFSIKRQVDYGD